MSKRTRKRRTTSLSGVDVNEVSLVGAGANQMADIVLMKSDDDQGEAEMADTEVEIPQEIQDQLDKLTKERDDALEAVEAANAVLDEIEKGEPEPEPEAEEDLLKDADPRIVELVKASQAEAQQSREAAAQAMELAKAEQDERLRRDQVDFASSNLAHLTKSADEMGTLLFKVRDAVDSETFDEFVRVLKAADEAAATGESITTEVGSDSEDENTPEGQIEKLAKSIRAEHPEMTEAQAFAKALDENPALYQG